MTELEKFKDQFPNAQYEEETNTLEWYNEDNDVVEILTDARWHLENHYEGIKVLSGHFTDPDNDEVEMSGYDYIRLNGGYQSAFDNID